MTDKEMVSGDVWEDGDEGGTTVLEETGNEFGPGEGECGRWGLK